VLAFLNANLTFLSAPSAQALLQPAGLNVIQGADGLTFGEFVGIALESPTTVGAALHGQVTNFLEDAAQGTAIYAHPLANQPPAGIFEGASTISAVGIASSVEHPMM
jgi:hypothetical protein